LGYGRERFGHGVVSFLFSDRKSNRGRLWRWSRNGYCKNLTWAVGELRCGIR
jgi:hypothetical protein